jgi:hypothetical protein
MKNLFVGLAILAAPQTHAFEGSCSETLGKVMEMGSYHKHDTRHRLTYESPLIKSLRRCSPAVDKFLKHLGEAGYVDLGWEMFVVVNLRNSNDMSTYIPFYKYPDQLAKEVALELEKLEGPWTDRALTKSTGHNKGSEIDPIEATK